MQARVLRVVTTALVALSLGLACGEEKSDDDDGGGSCPADAPANAASCSEHAPGQACTYDSITCTCSGISWNCTQGGGNSNSTGAPTGSGGNGFGNGFGNGSTGAPFGGD